MLTKTCIVIYATKVTSRERLIHFQHYLGAFTDPIFLFSSAMMLSSAPISASHCASSAGEGLRFAVGSEPSESKVMLSIGVATSLSNRDPASMLSHLTKLKSWKKHEEV